MNQSNPERQLKPPAVLEAHGELDERQAAMVREANETMQELDGMRAVQINVAGHFARSKIAWKLAGYQHALLHRVVSIFDGAALGWNHRSPIAAMLCSRAMMETVAIFYSLGQNIERYLKENDLTKLDDIAQNGVFATRDPEWLEKSPASKAINALGYIQKLDRLLPGFARHYDVLSERCHPNSQGHNFLFSELDQSDGTIRFMDERWQDHNRTLILLGITPITLVKIEMPRLDGLIEAVAELQHRVHPVGG